MGKRRWDLGERLERQAELAAWFADRSDDELLDLLKATASRTGWGLSRAVEVQGHQVFVKTLPMTDIELDEPQSTANLFGLPMAYNYGVGSAGFGAGRELAAHIKTTDWVQRGEIENFPLLHHHRSLPIAGQTRHMEPDDLDSYVDYWDGNEQIRLFIEARHQSTQALTLFIEHIPHVLQDWLPTNQEAVPSLIRQALSVTTFLRAKNVAHLDANLSNLLTDGQRLYFGDFGLFLDSEFDLSADEREFLASNRFLDIGQLLTNLANPTGGSAFEPTAAYQKALEPYRDITDAVQEFFLALMSGPKVTGTYDDTTIERLLTAASQKK